ncbi:MAG TPA: hypothetical protein VG714_04530 [Acidobacteriaceae bacterium]|nr:hypothetical protein [Acidobacteriaceae bacterium]
MSEPWVTALAGDIRQKNHEAAEEYGRAQHYAGIVAERGGEFFLRLTDCLQEGMDALRRELQGDVTAADMMLERVRVDEVRILRARFPWVDARLKHSGDSLMLDYSKGAGTAGDPLQDHVTRSYTLLADEHGWLRAEETFSDSPQSYASPEELARALMEILFRV